MSQEAQEQQAQEIVQEKADASAAFQAGFDDDDDSSAPTATPEPEKTPVAETPAPPPAPEFVQIKKEDWEALNSRVAKVDTIEANLGQRFDQAFGKMGGIERRLAEMVSTTPKGEVPEIGEADFEELVKEFPESAALTIKGINRVLGKLKPAGSNADPEAVSRLVNEGVEKALPAMRKEMIHTTLEAILPDWVNETKTPEYKEWLQGQPAEVQAYHTSPNLSDAARLLKSFAKAKETPAPAPTAAPTAPAQPSTRQRQIAAAVNPKGDAAAPPSRNTKSAFQQGFDEDD